MLGEKLPPERKLIEFDRRSLPHPTSPYQGEEQEISAILIY